MSTKNIIFSISVILFTIFSYFIFISQENDREELENSKNVLGLITDVGNSNGKYYIFYSYTVDGKTYEAQDLVHPNCFVKAHAGIEDLRMKYAINNPSISEINDKRFEDCN